MGASAEAKPVIMVSSTVYGIENLLEQLFAMLRGFGFEVWMSFKGTIPVDPQKSNFRNCLDAVASSDLFLGLISPFYGSGKDGDGLSITHQELLHAIRLKKPRWFLAHDHVSFARQILKQYRFHHDGKRNEDFRFHPTKVMDDIRVVDMYDAAIQDEVELAARTGHWAHSYFRDADACEFVSSQFGDVQRIRAMLGQWRAS
jgi:hypothetical protein